MSLESDFQSHVIKKLKDMFPGCMVLKNDTSYLQGIPDLTVLWRNRWAMLEVKADENSRERPNQRYYIEMADELSFGAFIFPQNESEVLYALQRSFKTRGASRVPLPEFVSLD